VDNNKQTNKQTKQNKQTNKKTYDGAYCLPFFRTGAVTGGSEPSGCFSHSIDGSYLAYGPLKIPGTHSQVANNYFNKSQNLAKDSQNLAKSANIAVQTTLFVAIVRSTYKGTLITHVTCLMASILTESGSQTVFNIF